MALEQVWLYASILLCGFMVAVIESRFWASIAWILACACLSTFGLIHHFKILDTDITTALGPAWEWVFGYISAALVLVVVKFTIMRPQKENDV